MTPHLEAISELENDLELPNGFISSLFGEPDWSFIIKLHVLLETVLTQLLIVELDKPQLTELIAKLDLRIKMNFLKKLGRIESGDRRFMDALSNIRNRLAHNIKNVNFSFDDFLVALSSVDKNEFLGAVGYYFKPSVVIDGKTHDTGKLIRDNPKQFLLLAARSVLSSLHVHKTITAIRAGNRKLLVEASVFHRRIFSD